VRVVYLPCMLHVSAFPAVLTYLLGYDAVYCSRLLYRSMLRGTAGSSASAVRLYHSVANRPRDERVGVRIPVGEAFHISRRIQTVSGAHPAPS